MKLKGPSKQPLVLFTCKTLIIIFYSEHVELKEDTNVTTKNKFNTLSRTQLTVKKYDFASTYNINNFDGIGNGSGQLGSFKFRKIKS